VHIDPIRLAGQGRTFSGQLALDSLPRLQGLLASHEGEITAEIVFTHDERDRPVMQGQLRGQLVLTCQRCLQDMEWPVEVDFEFVLIEADRVDSEAAAESEEVLIVESTPMVLADIIEDELMLSLPIVPMHDLEHCSSAKYVHAETDEEQGPADKPNPFAVLADLKRKDD
jgi:uncharacterized protein